MRILVPDCGSLSCVFHPTGIARGSRVKTRVIGVPKDFQSILRLLC